jgi:hypothetical protein
MQKTMFSIENFVSAGFGRFFPKTAAVRPPIPTANHFVFSAGFEVFCKIFGRLATVTGTAWQAADSDWSVRSSTPNGMAFERLKLWALVVLIYMISIYYSVLCPFLSCFPWFIFSKNSYSFQ